MRSPPEATAACLLGVQRCFPAQLASGPSRPPPLPPLLCSAMCSALQRGLQGTGAHAGEVPRNCASPACSGHCCFGCARGDKQVCGSFRAVLVGETARVGARQTHAYCTGMPACRTRSTLGWRTPAGPAHESSRVRTAAGSQRCRLSVHCQPAADVRQHSAVCAALPALLPGAFAATAGAARVLLCHPSAARAVPQACGLTRCYWSPMPARPAAAQRAAARVPSGRWVCWRWRAPAPRRCAS